MIKYTKLKVTGLAVTFILFMACIEASTTTPKEDLPDELTPNTSLNPPTSLTTTTTTTVPPVASEPGEISSIREINLYYNKTGTTCCHIQTACLKCKNFYEVNGIRYCCPQCRGYALVTNLICTCYPATPFRADDIKCRVNSSEVVGGYKVYRPSYPPNFSPPSLHLSPFLIITIITLLLT